MKVTFQEVMVEFCVNLISSLDCSVCPIFSAGNKGDQSFNKYVLSAYQVSKAVLGWY